MGGGRRGRGPGRGHPGGRPGRQFGGQEGGGGDDHDDHEAPRPGGHLSADRHPGARRRGAGPARAGREDRQLHRRPAVGRPQPGRRGVRGAGRRHVHPPGRRVPVPGGGPRRRPPLGTRARRGHPVAAVGPRLRPRRRHRPDPGAAGRRAHPRREHPRRRVRRGHLPSFRALRPLLHLHVDTAALGPRPHRLDAAGAHLLLLGHAPGRRGARLGGVGAHPVLVHLGRDLDLAPGDPHVPAVLLRASRTRWSTAPRRRRPTWSC